MLSTDTLDTELYFYCDGHVRVYHGDQTALPRHYVAREKLCLSATTDYRINANALSTLALADVIPWLETNVPQTPEQQRRLAEDPRQMRFQLLRRRIAVLTWVAPVRLPFRSYGLGARDLNSILVRGPVARDPNRSRTERLCQALVLPIARIFRDIPWRIAARIRSDGADQHLASGSCRSQKGESSAPLRIPGFDPPGKKIGGPQNDMLATENLKR